MNGQARNRKRKVRTFIVEKNQTCKHWEYKLGDKPKPNSEETAQTVRVRKDVAEVPTEIAYDLLQRVTTETLDPSGKEKEIHKELPQKWWKLCLPSSSCGEPLAGTLKAERTGSGARRQKTRREKKEKQRNWHIRQALLKIGQKRQQGDRNCKKRMKSRQARHTQRPRQPRAETHNANSNLAESHVFQRGHERERI